MNLDWLVVLNAGFKKCTTNHKALLTKHIVNLEILRVLLMTSINIFRSLVEPRE